METDLRELILETFPAVPAAELAYLPDRAGRAPLSVAWQFTIQAVGVAATGCTGGCVIAFSGALRQWLQTDRGPVPAALGWETFSVDLERGRDLFSADALAAGLRRRIARDCRGLVANVQAAPDLYVTMDEARMEVAA